MPCVLPVISLKLSTLLAGAEHESAEKQKRGFREHNIFFALGILLYFGVLSGILGITGMAWGQIFQKPPVVIGLTGVVFALSLSLFGLFNLPIVDLKLGSENSGPRRQALFTGILATLLANPMQRPLSRRSARLGHGAAALCNKLGFPERWRGHGLALYFNGHFPDNGNQIPETRSMDHLDRTCRRIFLAGTCIYLFSILPEDMYIPTMIFLWFTAVGAWMWGFPPEQTRNQSCTCCVSARWLSASVPDSGLQLRRNAPRTGSALNSRISQRAWDAKPCWWNSQLTGARPARFWSRQY